VNKRKIGECRFLSSDFGFYEISFEFSDEGSLKTA
jgi:hypothetical protein